jgi:DNA sulfur modification protein DndB
VKRRDVLLEDRVWSLLYAMGFTYLSGEGGAFLRVDPKRTDGPKNQIDVVGLDPEIAIAVECKSSSTPRKDSKFQDFLAKHSLIRERFANAANSQFPLDHKRVPVLAIFSWELRLSDNDIERAEEQKVALLNENDLSYYEQLVAHLGPAAKYQFFADMLRGRQVHGLRLAVPAVEARMGKYLLLLFDHTRIPSKDCLCIASRQRKSERCRHLPANDQEK